ncbi:MAG: 4Fe-4S binding protein [Thermoplasmata archaeon]|nr:4Fe-4S binding protein [Thermoplasmata archaeon]
MCPSGCICAGYPRAIDQAACIGCGACAGICPVGAVSSQRGRRLPAEQAVGPDQDHAAVAPRGGLQILREPGGGDDDMPQVPAEVHGLHLPPEVLQEALLGLPHRAFAEKLHHVLPVGRVGDDWYAGVPVPPGPGLVHVVVVPDVVLGEAHHALAHETPHPLGDGVQHVRLPVGVPRGALAEHPERQRQHRVAAAQALGGPPAHERRVLPVHQAGGLQVLDGLGARGRQVAGAGRHLGDLAASRGDGLHYGGVPPERGELREHGLRPVPQRGVLGEERSVQGVPECLPAGVDVVSRHPAEREMGEDRVAVGHPRVHEPRLGEGERAEVDPRVQGPEQVLVQVLELLHHLRVGPGEEHHALPVLQLLRHAAEAPGDLPPEGGRHGVVVQHEDALPAGEECGDGVLHGRQPLPAVDAGPGDGLDGAAGDVYVGLERDQAEPDE